MAEGPWTKVGAMAGILALILTYVGLAAANHWFPFPRRRRRPTVRSLAWPLLGSPHAQRHLPAMVP
jgi:hypothetical protein